MILYVVFVVDDVNLLKEKISIALGNYWQHFKYVCPNKQRVHVGDKNNAIIPVSQENISRLSRIPGSQFSYQVLQNRNHYSHTVNN
jgi:hypothetical protein